MDPSVKMFLIGLGVGLAIAVAYYYYLKQESYTPAIQAVEEPKIVPELVLFYSNGCGHCHRLAPTWSQVEEKLSSSPSLKVRKIESAQPESSLGRDIRGVPTIRLYPQGLSNPDNFVEYSGDRSLQDILKFADQ